MTTDPLADKAIAETMRGIGVRARLAMKAVGLADASTRSAAIRQAALNIRARTNGILAANRQDMALASERNTGAAMLDRLRLDEERVETIAQALDAIAGLPDPLGRVLERRERPNGLLIEKRSVPLGVIGIIYESRPNVTADAAALCIKSGNASILRGGSESFHSNQAIYACIRDALSSAGIAEDAVQLVPTTNRAAVGFMLSSMSEWLDVLIPRGGKSLVKRVQDEARIPVIGHLEGLCHVYVHQSANIEMAEEIVVNAKMRRTGICGAAETVLVDAAAPGTLVPKLIGALQDKNCEVRVDASLHEKFPDLPTASESDWGTEYLDAIVSLKVVDDIDAAIAHIDRHGSGHTDAIVSADPAAADYFIQQVDSAIVLHNASTQFADGGEFGMGAEIGIATGRVHARGPVGAEQLTSYKYVVHGAGQVRP